jgi:hypothetical protein
VTARPEAARPVTAPGEMIQVIAPGLTVPASAISESRSAGHSSVNVSKLSIGLVSDGSEPAKSATVSVKSITSGLELVSAGLKSSRSVFDGTLPVHDILGPVSDGSNHSGSGQQFKYRPQRVFCVDWADSEGLVPPTQQDDTMATPDSADDPLVRSFLSQDTHHGAAVLYLKFIFPLRMGR